MVNRDTAACSCGRRPDEPLRIVGVLLVTDRVDRLVVSDRLMLGRVPRRRRPLRKLGFSSEVGGRP